MNRNKLIEKMVNNYYLQSAMFEESRMTLEEYLKSIMFGPSPEDDESEPWTDADLQYGLSLERNK